MMQKKEMMMQFFESDLDPRLCMIEDMIERGEVYQGYSSNYTKPQKSAQSKKLKEEDLIKAVSSDKTWKEIAAQFGVTPSAVIFKCDQLGIKKEKMHRHSKAKDKAKLKAISKDEILKALDKASSFAGLARIFDISRDRMRNLFHQYGIDERFYINRSMSEKK
jgi:hypothetical protein